MSLTTLDWLNFPAAAEEPALDVFRGEVRSFLHDEAARGAFGTRIDGWFHFDAAFSRKLASKGWLGLCWPTTYGGCGRPLRYRFVLTEELLASGAPVAAHWVADRQSGPQILRFGTEDQKRFYLPKIIAGEAFFAIGMSEPDSGSDLASVRSRAVRVDGGWRVNGTKVWTSNAHRSNYFIALVRTAPGERHQGLSQFIVSPTGPGVSLRPIANLLGEHHFNEVSFQDAFFADRQLLGDEGQGWAQVTSELAHERSGPERFMSTYPLLEAALTIARSDPSSVAEEVFGRAVARLITLRQMSRSIAARLEDGQPAMLQAALVKDLGNVFEQTLPDVIRPLLAHCASLAADPQIADLLAQSVMRAPSFSLRGGTREIMRNIIAKSLEQ